MLTQQQLESVTPFFAAAVADPQLREAVAAHTSLRSLPRGQAICKQGDACTHLALVTRGTARVFKLAESGREITLYRVEAGECCILTASCMLSGNAFPANATVESDLDAVLIPQAQVIEWMGGYETWRSYLWNLLAERLGGVIGLVEEVAFRRMDRRLARYLDQQQVGGVLHTTHQQIAADLGTSREVVSRILKDFQLRGLLEVGRGRIKLRQSEGLRRIGAESD